MTDICCTSVEENSYTILNSAVFIFFFFFFNVAVISSFKGGITFARLSGIQVYCYWLIFFNRSCHFFHFYITSDWLVKLSTSNVKTNQFAHFMPFCSVHPSEIPLTCRLVISKEIVILPPFPVLYIEFCATLFFYL